MFRRVVTALCEFDDAPVSNVWVLRDLDNVDLIPVDVVEGEPLS